MNAAIEIIPVTSLFIEALRESFDDLDIPDRGATSYLADLLVRFAATTELLPEGVTGERLESIAERMAEIQRVWAIDAGRFDPARELHIRRALADYTLFMSGFFWESVKARSVTGHYVREGKRAYRFVAEYHHAQGHAEGALYQTLGVRFETYAAVISYMRDVHLGAEFAPWPPLVFARVVESGCPENEALRVGARRSTGSLVEHAQTEGTVVPLQNGQRAVVLFEGQQALEGQAEHATENHAIRPAVSDDGNRLGFVSGDDGHEGRPHPRQEIRNAFSAREWKFTDPRHPLLEGLGLTLRDLSAGQAVPAAHVHLPQGGHQDRSETVDRADDRAGDAGAGEIARVDGCQRHAAQARGLGTGLRLPSR